jgi:Na+/melibiose symporter-like transporter
VGGIREALGQRDLRLLLGAGLISMTGDWTLRIGLAYRVYVITGSTLATALMLLASFIPQMALGSVAGVFVDRWDRKRTMIVSNLLLAGGLLPLLLVKDARQVWVVYVVLALEGCVQQFFAPAEQALLPHLVEDEHLVTANALNAQTQSLARLLGGALGGVAAATGGIAALTVIDLISFLLAAGLIARIHRGLREIVEATPSRGRLAEILLQWTDGVRVAWREPVLRTILIFLLVTSVGEGIMGTLFAPFVRTTLHGSAEAYGLIVAMQAAGGIVGGLAAAWIGNRISASRLLGWGAVAFGAIDLVMFLYPLAWVAIWPAVLCMVVVGLPGALVTAGAMTLMQRHTNDSHRGRLFGALSAVEGVAVVAGTVAAGLLGGTVGIVPVLVTQGAGYVLAGIVVVVALRSDVSPSKTAHGSVAVS